MIIYVFERYYHNFYCYHYLSNYYRWIYYSFVRLSTKLSILYIYIYFIFIKGDYFRDSIKFIYLFYLYLFLSFSLLFGIYYYTNVFNRSKLQTFGIYCYYTILDSIEAKWLPLKCILNVQMLINNFFFFFFT